MKGTDFLLRHRNTLLLVLLVTTLLISGLASHRQLQSAPASVTIPVMETPRESLSALEAFRAERAAQVKADIAAPEKLCVNPSLEDSLLESAALQLQSIIDARQAESALEGALTGSSLSPCTAVLSGGSLTIVTEKEQITDKESALVLTLAAAHAGLAPENVRIITANSQ